MTPSDHTAPADDYMTLTQAVRELVSVMQHAGLRRLEVVRGDLRIALEAGEPVMGSRESETAPVSTMSPPTPHAATSETDLYTIVAPMVGTFYAAPGPNADPFVRVGDRVASGQTVAIIEAMKIMNEIVADRPGEVLAVLVTNGQPVEYGQPLIKLRTVPQ